VTELDPKHATAQEGGCIVHIPPFVIVGPIFVPENSTPPILVVGTDNNDVLSGGSADDVVYGGAGDDILRGYQGNDTIYGGDGNDYLDGYQDDNILFGGSGNDTLTGDREGIIRSKAAPGTTSTKPPMVTCTTSTIPVGRIPWNSYGG